jgi:DNA-binding transcriptional LysR family regulator
MELQHLRVFYEVARRGSFSAASRALRVTQPSLSRGVQSLERSLEARLFDRRPRGVSLTADGEAVFERCHRIFQECEAIERGAESEVESLRLAASENLCIHVLPRILARAFGGAAGVELRSGTAEEVIQAVMTRDADAGYCYHPSKTPGLACSTAASVEFWLIASAKKHGARPTPKALRREPFIGSISRSYAGPYAAKSLLEEAGLATLEATHQSNSQEAQLSLVAAGLGYSLVPWFVAERRIRSGAIVRVPTARTLRTPLFRITRVGAALPFLEKLDGALKRRVEP